MKIADIQATPINIPYEAPYRWMPGVCPGNTTTIVEVTTDENLVGIGEASSGRSAPVIAEELAPRLVGADPFDIEACERRCVREERLDYHRGDQSALTAFAGIEMALWDLRGKAWQQPLYKLLGGACRKSIPFTEYFAYRERKGHAGGESTPKAVAAYCAKMRELHGSVYFEGKPPVDTRATIEIAREVRSAVGDDAMIRLDGNMGFSLTAARHVLSQIEPYNINNFEEPVASFYDMAKLRQHSAIPFSSHIPDLRLAVRLGVPDNMVLNFSQLGGIGRTLRFVGACEAMDVGYWCYSGESAVGSAAYLHFAAALQHIHQPSQSLFRWQADDVTEDGPFSPKNGVLSVPEGPGLGVTLSPKALQRCHERFLAEGAYDGYLDPTRPDYFARIPLA
jgi:glucarate dehydratase